MPRSYLPVLLTAIVTVCLACLGLRWRALNAELELPRAALSQAAEASVPSGNPGSAPPQPLLSATGTAPAGADAPADMDAPASTTQQQQAATPAPRPLPRRVNINTASATELDTLPGIGPVIAERIVQHRRRHGLFARVEDLQQVEGIGPKKLAELKSLAYVDPAQ